MAEQGERAGGGVAAPGATAEAGPLGAVLLAFEQTAVTAEAARVRDAGVDTAASAADLVAALEEASAAAAGMAAGGAGALLTGRGRLGVYIRICDAGAHATVGGVAMTVRARTSGIRLLNHKAGYRKHLGIVQSSAQSQL